MGWGLKNLGTRGRIVGAGAVTHFFQCDPARAKADVASVLAASPAEQCFVGHFGPVTRDEVVAFVEAP
jgi:hypothetical protein